MQTRQWRILPIVAACVLSLIVSEVYGADETTIVGSDVFRSVLRGETLADSGFICLNFRLSGPESSESLQKAIGPEVAAADRIELWWDTKYRFRVEVEQQGKPLLRIVSDGRIIDTGGKLWDIRFFTDTISYPNETNQALQEEFTKLVWPLELVLRYHLRPVSGGIKKNPDKLEGIYSARFESKTNDEIANGVAEANLILTFKSNARYSRRYKIGHYTDYFVESNRFSRHTNDSFYFTRTAPLFTLGAAVIPSVCEVSIGIESTSSPGWISTVCEYQVGRNAGSVDYRIEAQKKVVLWPNGDRFRNFFYRIREWFSTGFG